MCAVAPTGKALASILRVAPARNLARRSGAIAPIDHQEKTVNKDQVKGRLKQAEGKVKEVAGKLTGNKTLEQKGKVKNAAGDVQADYGDLKNDVAKSL